MIACTSPAFTVRLRPLRIALPSISAWRLSIFSMLFLGPAASALRQILLAKVIHHLLFEPVERALVVERLLPVVDRLARQLERSLGIGRLLARHLFARMQ